MLADYQEALSRLLVDARLRALRRPAELAAALEPLTLAPAELASLLAIDAAQLERAAASLASKRRRAVEATVPLCARLWPELGARYLDHLGERPAPVGSIDPLLGPGANELARCLPRLQGSLRRDELVPPWAADLLGLEFARACSRHDGRTRELRCAYLVHQALAALAAGWLSVELEPRACVYLIEPERLRWREGEGERAR